MSARNRRKKKDRQPKSEATPAAETPVRAVEVLTVAWMLAVICTLVAELFAVIFWLVIVFVANKETWPNQFLAFPGLLLFVATITGIVSLILMSLCVYWRSVRAPRSIIVSSVVIGSLPIVVGIAFMLRGS